MSKAKLDNLSELAKTLLITLYVRARESQRPDGLLRDEAAVAMFAQIDYDFRRARLERHDEVAIVLRLLEFDRQVRRFLEQHPDAVVVHIGCGLDTRFERVDNGRVEWYDLDLPEVIGLREKLIGAERARYHHLACSVNENGWQNRVRAGAGRAYLFVAEGVLPYLEEEQVRRLVLTLRREFPGAELVLDSHTPFVVWADNLQFALVGIGARLHWSMRRGTDMEAWAPGIRLLQEWFYYDDPEPRLRAFRWARHVPFLRESSGIYHYRLGNAHE